MKTCKIDDKRHYAKGYCRSHYIGMRKYGSVEAFEAAVANRAYKGPCIKCGTTESTVWQAKHCKACYSLDYYHNHQGKSQGEWYKEVVGYSAAHARVRAVKGHARLYDCQVCKGPATEWALSADTPVERLHFEQMNAAHKNVSAYSLDPDDYIALCHTDHIIYDTQTGNRHYKTGKYAQAKCRYK